MTFVPDCRNVLRTLRQSGFNQIATVKKISSHIIRRLAEQRRRVAGEWRLRALWNAAFRELHLARLTDQSFAKMIADMSRDRWITEDPTASGVFRIDAPFAHLLPVVPEHIVQEAAPTAVFCGFTAMLQHGWTDEVAGRQLCAMGGASEPEARIGLGIAIEDWIELGVVRSRRLPAANGMPVRWVQTGTHQFGWCVRDWAGVPLYYTDPERTLIDGLRQPKQFGEFSDVLRMWRRGIEFIDAEKLCETAERFGSQILLQRLGYVLEQLGHSTARSERWRDRLLRGSSVRLVASEPYAATHSVRWNLSLNAPSSVLAELDSE